MFDKIEAVAALEQCSLCSSGRYLSSRLCVGLTLALARAVDLSRASRNVFGPTCNTGPRATRLERERLTVSKRCPTFGLYLVAPLAEQLEIVGDVVRPVVVAMMNCPHACLCVQEILATPFAVANRLSCSSTELLKGLNPRLERMMGWTSALAIT